MLHLRIVSPPDRTERVIARLSELDSVINVVRLSAVALKPPGDLILCDVAREEGSVVIASLRRMGLDEDGTIAVENVYASISSAADAAEDAAAGSPADAVVWEEVEAQTATSAELTVGFVLLMVLATVIAAIGILTDSVILVIGAMVVGPEFGALAGVCVATVQRRPRLAIRSLTALLVGFPMAIAVTAAFVLVLVAIGVAPEVLVQVQTRFISEPDEYAVLVALLAGSAGMLSLTTSKSSALIGVFVSVTTIPAAADIGVALAYQHYAELGGAAVQLGLNLVCIVVAGVLTLLAQRLAFVRRARAAIELRRRRLRDRRRAR